MKRAFVTLALAAFIVLGAWLLGRGQIRDSGVLMHESVSKVVTKSQISPTELVKIAPSLPNGETLGPISESSKNQENAAVDPRVDTLLGMGGFVRDYTDEVKRYLAEGGNTNLRDKNGFSLLQQLSTFGDAELVKLALAHGANSNSENWSGMTPLDYAAMTQNAKIIQQLLEHGADPNHPATQLGEVWRPLSLVTWSRSEDVWWRSRYHVIPGPPPSEVITESRILPDYVESVRLLTNAGADPNAPGRENRTPIENVTALCDRIRAFPHHSLAVQELETKLCGEATDLLRKAM
jgi:hypothetical protein